MARIDGTETDNLDCNHTHSLGMARVDGTETDSLNTTGITHIALAWLG